MKDITEEKQFALASEVEEFFTMRSCDCEKKCKDGVSDHCRVRYLNDLVEGLEGVGLLEKGKRHCFKCARIIRGNFFIPDGDHEFCSIQCHTSWRLRPHRFKRRSLEKSTDIPSERRPVLDDGDGCKTVDRTPSNRRRKSRDSDA